MNLQEAIQSWIKKPNPNSSGFWDAEHWCGPSPDEQVKRTLQWDEAREWYRCEACGREIHMLVRDIESRPLGLPKTEAGRDIVLAGAYHVEGCAVYQRGGPGCDCGLPDALLTVEQAACDDFCNEMYAAAEAEREKWGGIR